MIRTKKVNKNAPTDYFDAVRVFYRVPSVPKPSSTGHPPKSKKQLNRAPSLNDSPHPLNNISPKNIAILSNLRQKVLKALVSLRESRSSNVVRSRIL